MSLPKPDHPKTKSDSNAFLKYAGMGFQFFILVFIAALGGQKLDRWLDVEPLFTVSLIMFFAVAFFIKLYYELIK